MRIFTPPLLPLLAYHIRHSHQHFHLNSTHKTSKKKLAHHLTSGHIAETWNTCLHYLLELLLFGKFAHLGCWCLLLAGSKRVVHGMLIVRRQFLREVQILSNCNAL